MLHLLRHSSNLRGAPLSPPTPPPPTSIPRRLFSSSNNNSSMGSACVGLSIVPPCAAAAAVAGSPAAVGPVLTQQACPGDMPLLVPSNSSTNMTSTVWRAVALQAAAAGLVLAVALLPVVGRPGGFKVLVLLFFVVGCC